MSEVKKNLNPGSRGTLLVEILVASAVLGTILMATAAALGVNLDGMQSGKLQNTATFLLQEELEPLLTIRDSGWNNLKNGTFYIAPQGTSWTLIATTSGETVGQFTRKVTISDAYRDNNGQIVSTGGNLDPSTKKAQAQVSWQTILPHQIQATTYITRYKDNLSWTQTTKADFDLGTNNSTIAQYTDGSATDGEVVLAAGGQGDWCRPDPQVIPSLDVPGNGVGDAVTAIEDRAFAGTGQNASGTPFADISISNTNPPVASIRGTFARNGIKTNAVFGESNYAYIATDTNSEEIVIIDISTPPNYTQAGFFDAPGNGNGNSVFVTSNYGYMISSVGDKLYNFNKPGNNLPIDIDGVALDGPGNKVVVVGNYAYVAAGLSHNQLDIIDVGNPTDLKIIGRATVSGSGARDVFVNATSTRAYLATAYSATSNDFFIIDINPASPTYLQTLGSYNTNGMDPKGLTVVTNNKAIIVGIGAEEYQVISITNDSPSRCGGVTPGYNIYGVSSVLESDGDVYSYIITTDINEFHIIQGGPGGKFSTSGTFTSSTIPAPDLSQSTAFNRFEVNFNQPLGTNITFQVAVADVGLDGTCATATYSFVGPDATGASYFSGNGIVPIGTIGSSYRNPGRCFRYRAYLTTSETTQTPTLYDFTVSYSP